MTPEITIFPYNRIDNEIEINIIRFREKWLSSVQYGGGQGGSKSIYLVQYSLVVHCMCLYEPVDKFFKYLRDE